MIALMTALEEVLRGKVALAEERIAALRNSLEEAERELKVWESALELESNHRDTPDLVIPGLIPSANRSLISLDDAKSKKSMVLAAVRNAGRPIGSGELINLLHPTVSRRMIFEAIKQLKEEGKVKTDRDGHLVSTETNS